MRKFNEEELENMDMKDFLASSSGSEDDNSEIPTRIGNCSNHQKLH